MQNTGEQADEQKIGETIEFLTNLLLSLSAEPEVIAAMSMEDVDRELKEMGIDPNISIPASINETLTRIQATWEEEEPYTASSSSPADQVGLPAVFSNCGVSTQLRSHKDKPIQEDEIESSPPLGNAAMPDTVHSIWYYVIALALVLGVGGLVATLISLFILSLPRSSHPGRSRRSINGSNSGYWPWPKNIRHTGS